MTMQENVEKIREIISREKKVMEELKSLFSYLREADEQERRMINSQVEKLRIFFKKTNEILLETLDVTLIPGKLEEVRMIKTEKEVEKELGIVREKKKWISLRTLKEKIPELDKEVLKRIKKSREKVKVKKPKKPSQYVKIANDIFGNFVKSLIREKKMVSLQKDLIKSNLGHTPIAYISVLILTTIIAIGVAIILFVFFIFFNIGPDLPIITRATEAFGTRLMKIFWILIVVPLGTFIFMYFYPSLEKRSAESKIDIELPFATIHMAAIAGSLIEPLKVFSIISATKEYPNLEREFNKLLNEINVYGYDIVTALKSVSSNCPSIKLAELFNGLATTITSGGSMFDFFDKRSQTLLFDYKLDREKRTKTAETFMDIYISVVIAAPMILMLLLMMMKISGFGISLSTSMITLLVVGGVSLVNIFFLMFLQLKQPEAI